MEKAVKTYEILDIHFLENYMVLSSWTLDENEQQIIKCYYIVLLPKPLCSRVYSYNCTMLTH